MNSDTPFGNFLSNSNQNTSNLFSGFKNPFANSNNRNDRNTSSNTSIFGGFNGNQQSNSLFGFKPNNTKQSNQSNQSGNSLLQINTIPEWKSNKSLFEIGTTKNKQEESNNLNAFKNENIYNFGAMNNPSLFEGKSLFTFDNDKKSVNQNKKEQNGLFQQLFAPLKADTGQGQFTLNQNENSFQFGSFKPHNINTSQPKQQNENIFSNPFNVLNQNKKEENTQKQTNESPFSFNSQSSQSNLFNLGKKEVPKDNSSESSQNYSESDNEENSIFFSIYPTFSEMIKPPKSIDDDKINTLLLLIKQIKTTPFSSKKQYELLSKEFINYKSGKIDSKQYYHNIENAFQNNDKNQYKNKLKEIFEIIYPFNFDNVYLSLSEIIEQLDKNISDIKKKFDIKEINYSNKCTYIGEYIISKDEEYYQIISKNENGYLKYSNGFSFIGQFKDDKISKGILFNQLNILIGKFIYNDKKELIVDGVIIKKSNIISFGVFNCNLRTFKEGIPFSIYIPDESEIILLNKEKNRKVKYNSNLENAYIEEIIQIEIEEKEGIMKLDVKDEKKKKKIPIEILYDPDHYIIEKKEKKLICYYFKVNEYTPIFIGECDFNQMQMNMQIKPKIDSQLIFPNGDIYTNGIDDNLAQNSENGKLFLKESKFILEGIFKDNLCIEGKIYKENKEINNFKGKFNYNQSPSYGEIIKNSQCVYQGNVNENFLPDGNDVTYSLSKFKSLQSNWENGQKQGKGIYTINQKEYPVYFKDNILYKVEID